MLWASVWLQQGGRLFPSPSERRVAGRYEISQLGQVRPLPACVHDRNTREMRNPKNALWGRAVFLENVIPLRSTVLCCAALCPV